MNHSQRVFIIGIVLVCSVANAQDTYIRIYNGVNPYWGWPNSSLSIGQDFAFPNQGFYYGGPVYRYWYYDPWPWDNYSRYKHEQELEWRRELMTQRREDKADARYRNRARINGAVGLTMYSDR